MINFRCNCGYLFSVPLDLAGTSLQCPECKLLADVPLLSDLDDMEDDGTIKVEELKLKSEPERAAELRRIYMPGRVDDQGREIDLRNTMEDVEEAGVDEVPLELKDEVRPGAPKYDPVTGELIEPLRLKGDDQPKRVIPLDDGSPKPLGYSREAALAPRVKMSGIPLALLKPGSLAVLLVMTGVHLLSFGVWMMIGWGMLFCAFIALLVYMVMFAHVANVVEDMGPDDKDELPTPLRGVAFGEDIWHPFVRVFDAFVICYLPALVLMGPRTIIPCLALAALGTFVFPAVFLTLCTSGSIYNLRPDRVFSVIGRSSADYVVSVALWIGSIALYVVALQSCTAHAFSMGQIFGHLGPRPILPPWLAYPLMFAGIYMVHAFCWHLGLIYRKHHDHFPWVLQRHVSTKPPLVRKKRGPYVPKPREAAAAVEPKPVQPLEVEPLKNPEDSGARFA